MKLTTARWTPFAAVIGSICAMLAGCAEGGGGRVDVARLADRPLYTFTEEELGAYLPHARKRWPALTDRIVGLGRQNIGQPYDIYLLGEFPFETHDPDPIYCLSKSDCVTFSEHTYAMALSADWWSFLQTLQRIRYRDGVVGMLTRNHYTVPDWDPNNGFLFDDMTEALGGGNAWVPLRQTCRRSRFFAKFGMGQDIRDEPIEDAFIPKDRIPAVEPELRNGDFVNIVRGNDKTQWAGHTGLIAIADDGTVDFLHSAGAAVREQPLIDYVGSDKRCVGIKILRLKPGAEQIMRRTLTNSPKATPITEASLNRALAKRRAAAPRTARPARMNWREAMRLQAYRLERDTAVDEELQAAVEKIDAGVAAELGIPDGDRAIGVLDLTDLRLAMVEPDRMFYAASVPKICILLAYFESQVKPGETPPLDVMRELGRMIKASDNALAAKYSQIVGIERIQKVLQSRRYQFYDTKKQNGMWVGKHYGLAQPRFGDPVHDYSHAATVRQVLRFYLMLEQGGLVSADASTRMREIFASPELELADVKFVAGLQGRDLTLIRKSGTWEDWLLDTARVEHGDRVYLIAGMTHHAKGNEYLARAAAAIDDLLCEKSADKPYAHTRITHSKPEDFGANADGGEGLLIECPLGDIDDYDSHVRFVSPIIESDMLFNEAVISFNADAPPGVSYCLEARVGRRRDNSWSPFLYFLDWGTDRPLAGRLLESREGKIDTDYFTSEERFDRVQYRLRAVARPLEDGGNLNGVYVQLSRVDVTLSDTTGRITSVPREDTLRCLRDNSRRRLDVPIRSQRAERDEIAGRICSPTSVTMVLAYRGVDLPVEEVADRAYDVAWDIYGNWPRNVQAAYTYGIPGYIERFSDWHRVEDCIAQGQPLIISIRAKEGELAGAPYKSTNGHLLVLTGFDRKGNVLANDPAASPASKGKRVYSRSDLETVWMKAKGGTAYVLLPPRTVKHPPYPESAREGFVEVAAIDPRIVVDLRYATENNFTGKQLYPSDSQCMLRESVARSLVEVQDRLARRGLGLKVYDGFRPLSVQKKMWEVMPDPKYVADPAKGSRHNRGAAVDVTLVDYRGREIEMPTPYDDFTEAAHRDYKGGTSESRRHRKILEDAMRASCFEGLSSEWWHFDAKGWQAYPIADLSGDQARDGFSIPGQ